MNRITVGITVAAAAAAVVVLGHPAPTSSTSVAAAPVTVTQPSGWKPKNPDPFGQGNPYEIDHSQDNTISPPVIGLDHGDTPDHADSD